MRLVSFGEILFDKFENTYTLGGAPLNVAAHFKQLGGESSIISAVGNDEKGQRAFKEIKTLGVDSSMIDVIDSFPTGIAEITMVGHDADYTFTYPSAWDRITVHDEYIEKIDSNTILYFGSLALRSTPSFLALDAIFSECAPKEIFLDLNFRKNFFSEGIIDYALSNATILKINEAELKIVADVLGLKDDEASSLFAFLKGDTAIRTLLLTKGKGGSELYTEEGIFYGTSSDVVVVDTVGAGDSLVAAYLFFKYVEKFGYKEALDKATAVADFVVANKGAIPLYTPQMFY